LSFIAQLVTAIYENGDLSMADLFSEGLLQFAHSLDVKVETIKSKKN
jgi:hypothetical protein